MSQSQNALPLNDPLLEESSGENFLIRRLGEHGHPVFVMDLTVSARIAHYRKTILEAGLDATVIGRAPNGKPETYAQFFHRHFGEPLTTKAKVK
jgi:hypothetical protein